MESRKDMRDRLSASITGQRDVERAILKAGRMKAWRYVAEMDALYLAIRLTSSRTPRRC